MITAQARSVIALLLTPLVGAATQAELTEDSALGMVAIGPGVFHSVLPPGETDDEVYVRRFLLSRLPVTNGQFLAFTTSHPKWRRDQVVRLFADEGYLSLWGGPRELGPAVEADQPVTNVSWFAATAYCESLGTRLPTWYEWEFSAAADEDRADAREDPLWRQTILNWYAMPSTRELGAVGSRSPNLYGVYDLHGLVWEWVQDYNALLVGTDNREQGGADKLQFCGAGALSMEQKEQYAVLMRVAMLSSLEAAYTTRNLGFRCAKDI